MSRFTTRVELHNAKSYDDYERLHSQMEGRGFTRTIQSDDAVRYHLPTAEYDYVGNVTCEQVRELARAAAAAVDRSYSVLVTEAVRRNWYGLSPV